MRKAVRWPSITDHVVISGGQAATKRHPTCPTGRAVASLPKASRRTVLWIPSAPITRSYSPAVPSPNSTESVPFSLAEPADVDSHPDRHVASPVEQHGMEICAMEREAGPDAVPQLREIDLDEQPAAVVAEALPRDHDRSLR